MKKSGVTVTLGKPCLSCFETDLLLSELEEFLSFFNKALNMFDPDSVERLGSYFVLKVLHTSLIFDQFVGIVMISAESPVFQCKLDIV